MSNTDPIAAAIGHLTFTARPRTYNAFGGALPKNIFVAVMDAGGVDDGAFCLPQACHAYYNHEQLTKLIEFLETARNHVEAPDGEA